MSIYKRKNKWWVDFSFQNKRYRFCSPENSASGARAYEGLLRQGLLKGENISTKIEPCPVFSAFAEKWFINYVKSNNKFSEYCNKQSVYKVHLEPFFGKLSLDQITAYKIEEFKALKTQSTLAPKTINKMLSTLRKALNTAEEWGLLVSVPKIKLLKVPPQKFDYLLPEEEDFLLENTEGIWHNMILLALKTGLRFGEIIALNWEDIDFSNKLLTVRHSIVRGIMGSPKSNKIRYVPMTDSLLEMLWNKSKNEDYIFTLGNNKPMKQIYCLKNMTRICKKLNIRKIGWHVLRHTFASRLANNGVSMKVIQELLGHSDITTTMRYAHLSPITLRESIRTLDNRKAIELEMCHKNVTNVTITNLKETDLAPVKSQIFREDKQKQTSLSASVF